MPTNLVVAAADCAFHKNVLDLRVKLPNQSALRLKQNDSSHPPMVNQHKSAISMASMGHGLPEGPHSPSAIAAKGPMDSKKLDLVCMDVCMHSIYMNYIYLDTHVYEWTNAEHTLCNLRRQNQWWHN